MDWSSMDSIYQQIRTYAEEIMTSEYVAENLANAQIKQMHLIVLSAVLLAVTVLIVIVSIILKIKNNATWVDFLFEYGIVAVLSAFLAACVILMAMAQSEEVVRWGTDPMSLTVSQVIDSLKYR